MLRFDRDGESLYPRLAEVLDLVRATAAGPGGAVPAVRIFPDRVERALGRVRAVVHAARRPDRAVPDLRRRLPGQVEENLTELETLQGQLAAGAPLDLEPTSELASEFIHSVQTGTPREIYVNVRNDGRIANLPSDCCVEVPCDLSAGRAEPRSVGALPVQLAALNRTFLNVAELTVHAALAGSREHVYQAALLDPNTAAQRSPPSRPSPCATSCWRRTRH